MTEYKEIREILDRWYSGLSTPDEQRRLEKFFSDADRLPPDLETERELFAAIAAAEDQEVEVPADLAERIDAALEAEMARERKAASGSSKWRRRIIAACGAAACLMVGWVTVRTIVDPDRGQGMQNVRMASNVTPPVRIQPEDKVISASDTVLPAVITVRTEAESPVRIAAARPARKAKAEKTVVAAGHEDDGYEDYYLSKAEEEQLIAENYHVVEDEQEANVILSSVFARLESSMVEESYRIGDINDQYEMELTKLYN